MIIHIPAETGFVPAIFAFRLLFACSSTWPPGFYDISAMAFLGRWRLWTSFLLTQALELPPRFTLDLRKPAHTRLGAQDKTKIREFERLIDREGSATKEAGDMSSATRKRSVALPATQSESLFAVLKKRTLVALRLGWCSRSHSLQASLRRVLFARLPRAQQVPLRSAQCIAL